MVPKMNPLTANQHAFFRQIADLAFTNPFSSAREQADCALLGIAPGSMGWLDRVETIQARLKCELDRLQRKKPFNIRDYSEKTYEIMLFSWLFYAFHEVQDDFSAFIHAQGRAGDHPIPLPFARRLIGMFEQAGFTPRETADYIALFYQIQRGYHFISESIHGQCDAMIELRMRLWNNIFTFNPHWYLNHLSGTMEDFSTLLLGETGTGKSLVAHAIGCSGLIPFDLEKRRFEESFAGAFQAINLSQYSAGLLESELFGHKKGAFTGAIDHHPGLFARCSRFGAVFIDEIGDIDLPTQVKLLGVLQERVFSPVGSHEKLRFSGRVISATNRDLQQLRQDKRFRDDFYYRLCSDVITLPSLRQRLGENPAELRDLVTKLLSRILRDPDERLVEEVERKIAASVPEDHPWPGNVRELEQCIRQICLAGVYRPMPRRSSSASLFSEDDLEKKLSAKQLLQAYCRSLYERHGSYQAVAQITQLDRRTVRKYVVD